MQVDAKVHADKKAVDLTYTVPPGTEMIQYLLDGKEFLIDGKRHYTFDETDLTVTMGIPQDGKPHTFGVEAQGGIEVGTFAYDPNPAPPPPPTSTRKNLWTADFENGFGHFDPQDTAHGGIDSCGSDAHCELVPIDPSWGMPGTKAMQCRVMGDSYRPPNPQNAHTTRAQGNMDPAFFSVKEGDEVWLEWMLRIPSDPLLNNGSFTGALVLWQFGAGYGPQIILQDRNDGKGPMFDLASGWDTPPRKHFWYAPLIQDHSFKINLHCLVSTDPKKGILELDWDGVKVVPPSICQTLHGPGQRFCLDMYRGDNSAQNGGKGYNTTSIFSAVTRYTP